MMKKHISLLAFATLMSLSVGLRGTETTTTTSESSSSSAGNRMPELFPWFPSSRNASNVGISFSTNATVNSLASDTQAKSLAAQAEKVISDAFKPMDDWMSKNLAGRGEYDSYGSLVDYTYTPNSKMSEAQSYLDNVFNNLEKSLEGTSLKAMRDVVSNALTAFSTSLTITTEGTISNKVLAGIVNSVKLAMVVPVRIAVRDTFVVLGASIGAVGGAGAGLGSGLYRAGRNLNKDMISGSVSDSDITKAAKFLANTIAKVVRPFATVAQMTAYGALEGLVIGAGISGKMAMDVTGGKNFYVLNQNDKQKAAESERTRRAIATEQSEDLRIASRIAIMPKGVTGVQNQHSFNF